MLYKLYQMLYKLFIILKTIQSSITKAAPVLARCPQDAICHLAAG